MGFPGGSVVRNPTAKQEMQETWVPYFEYVSLKEQACYSKFTTS